VLAFRVTLAPARTETVMVRYATADGTAQAGADYGAVSGVLTFAPGETAKTVAVPVLDDAHDEGEETMRLVLSGAAGAALADAEATGTIVNTDVIPGAWLARFGRTVTGQVLETVAERLAAPRAPGAEATLAGRALPLWQTGEAANPGSQAEAGDNAGAGKARAQPQARGLSGREMLAGTSFALTGGGSEVGGHAALWGRGAVTRFDGQADGLSLDGEVATGLVGADWASDPGAGTGGWTAGLAVGHSRGTGGYGGTGTGRVEAMLTGVYPYAGMQLTERVSAWATAGHGTGEVEVTPEDQKPLSADLSMTMGATGLRGQVLAPEANDGLSLALKADGRWNRTSSDAAANAGGGKLAAARTETWMLRAGIEASRRVALGAEEDGATLTPSFELGLRLDGGDAETGFGADVGGGLALADPARGLKLDLKARTLLAHEASGFREWGASAALSWRPRPSTDRGLALALGQSWGAESSGGMEALLARESLAGLAADPGSGAGAGDNDGAAGRTDLELGYGLAAFGGGFTQTPNLGVALAAAGAREVRLGWRLTSAGRGDVGVEVNLDATRTQPANNGDIAHGAMLKATVRW
jgi:hypothetical protein